MATITAIKERISQLSPAGFQTLCDAYLSHEGYPDLVALGTMAGAEKTTKGTPDTYFCNNNGKYVFAEYTIQTTGIVEKIKSDLEKCLNPESTGVPLEALVEIVYCHTLSNISPQDDYYLKKLCEKSGVKLTLIGIDKLAEDLFSKYHGIVKDYLNLSIDTEQIQSYDDFLKQHDANAMTAPLNTDFYFREKEMSQISEAFKYCNIVLLCGPAGVGKTRLALEYGKTRTDHTSEIFYCIHSRSIPLYDDIYMFFEKQGNYFLFIDDANQLSQIKLILEFVNKQNIGFNVQIIASVRDYALQNVKDSITGIYEYKDISVKPFTDEQIRTIIKNSYGIINSRHLERIAIIAEGNCRIAVLAAKISCNTTDMLNSINDATQLYSEYYGKVLEESGLYTDSLLLKTAGVMAFLNSVHLAPIDHLLPVLTAACLAKEVFIEYLHKLHDNELVDIYYDKTAVFPEQCLSNYILKYVFCDKKILSLSQMIYDCFVPYRSKTIHSVNTLINVFRNDSLISFVKSEICDVWNKLACEKSPNFMDYVKAFYLANQTETLIIIKNKIKSIECVSIDPSEIDTKSGKNSQSIDDDILEILGGFAGTENLESALELYFEYYLKRPDQYIKFFHAFVKYYSVVQTSFDCKFYTQKLFVKMISKYSDNWANRYICLLFLDISVELLKLAFSTAGPSRNGCSIVMRHFSVPPIHEVFEYRDIIWNGLSDLAETNDYLSDIIKCLQQYGNNIDETNKGVVKHDSEFICRIMLSHCSVEDLDACLTADYLQSVFLSADLQTDSLEPFTNSYKMRLYNLLSGPKPDSKSEYNEYEEKHRQNIIIFIRKSANPFDAFVLLYKIYQECLNISYCYCDKYKAAQGINTALQALSEDKEVFLNSAKLLIQSEISEEINPFHTKNITNNLFRLMDKSEVYSVISAAPPTTANIWEYSYFSELPIECIDQIELQRLYDFLRKDNDQFFESHPSRDIFFVNKFSVVDENVLINASEIVLSKQTYSPLLVSVYFDLLFNHYCHSPADVVNMFSKNITLLEKIYSFLESETCNFDYNGKFLYEIYLKDKNYLSQFTRMLVDKQANNQINSMSNKCRIFYNNENYISIIDSIIQDAFTQVEIAKLYMPDIIEQFMIFSAKDDNGSKTETWIAHYIVTHSHEPVPMFCLFSALVRSDINQMEKYLEIFIENNKDFKLFEQIPLTPDFYSWTGSIVPLYLSFITNLEALLPLFHGIDFIEHKKRVEDHIQYYRNQIKAEEAEEALTNYL